MSPKIFFKKLSPHAIVPYMDEVGYNLHVLHEVTLQPNAICSIRTGISALLNDSNNFIFRICCDTSDALSYEVWIKEHILPATMMEEICLIMKNTSNTNTFQVRRKATYAKLIIMPRIQPEVQVIDYEDDDGEEDFPENDVPNNQWHALEDGYLNWPEYGYIDWRNWKPQAHSSMKMDSNSHVDNDLNEFDKM